MSKPNNLRRAAERAKAGASAAKSYEFAVQPPQLMPGIAPQGITPPVMAMDINPYQFAASAFPGGGFPGFPYLAQLSTRAEYRQMAAALSTEITREWITFTSKQDDADDSNEKIKIIEDEFKRLNVRGVIQKIAEQDCYFGRGQIFLDIAGADRKTPLILDPRTIKQGSLERIVAVEAVWTTPSAYNALDPAAPDFYRPTSWFMLGQEVHASRLLTIITRPLPDILKAAFNFGGMSLSQLAEPYVDNWLRTRQSVADLLNNFSITALKTSMEQILQGNDGGTDLFARADLFTATRSNKGLMLLDKDREELVQVNVPLGGLHELQAQAQEHMCAVSRMPAIILTGISPSGLNASSDGEIRVFYDWIAAQQESNYREPLEIILKVVQLSKFGEIDPDIGFDFNPLYQMTPGELADIRLKDSQSATAYIDRGVVEPGEVRERLARDPASGFQGLDTSVEIVPPNQPENEAAQDKSVSAAQHRAMEAAAHGHSTLGIQKNVGEEFVAQDADKWITVHPNGEGSTGSPVLIGENGEVKGGMGGKFNGKNIKDAHGTKEFTSGETNAETEARKKENTEGESKSAKPVRPEWYQKMRDSTNNPYWNGKFYGTTGNYSIFIDNKRRNISDEEKSELEKYMSDKSKYDEEQKPIIEAQKAAEKAGGTYLHVPYDNREEAKKAGAKWDADKKKWYMPAGKEVPESLAKYTSAPAAQKSTSQSSSASVGKKMADMTTEELHKKARNYDMVINGGGEGYNPFTAEIQKRDAKAAANEPRQHHWAYSEEAVQRALRGEDSMPEGMGEDADPDEASEDDPRNYDSYDKSVSESQRKAMQAAAHGESTLGIPEKVGKEFVKKDEGK